MGQDVLYLIPADNTVKIVTVEVGHQQRTSYRRLLQIAGVGHKGTLCILLRVGITQEEEIAFRLCLVGSSLRSEPVVIAIIDTDDTAGVYAQLTDDVLPLKVRNSYDSPALVKDTRHVEPTIKPTKVLIEGVVALVARLKENNIVERKYQGYVTPDGGCIAGTMKQLDTKTLGGTRQGPLFPKRI